jgi:hypothetical protein
MQQHSGLESLDALEQLLGRQADAIRSGDADALPALAEQLQQRLGSLAAQVRGRSLPPAWRERLLALIERAQASRSMLARRQLDVGRSLDALAAGSPRLQELQARRVYAASGTLAASAWRGGFERA